MKNPACNVDPIKRHFREKGFTLVAAGICSIVLFGMAGLAVDIGRMYITKNEAQSYADSASLYAAQQLDGTATGLSNADTVVSNNPNKWNFGTTAFSGTVTEYSTDGSTGWAVSTAVANPANIRYARVTATVNSLALYLMPVIGTGNSATVKATAISGQTIQGTSAASPVRNNVFPYSPIANVDGTTTAATGDPFGFTPGQQYDLKWPANPSVGTVGSNKVPCAGDDNQAMVNRAQGSWGEIVFNSAAAISAQITDNANGIDVYVGQSVSPTNGEKNKEVTAFQDRVNQDGDTTDNTYSAYVANSAHNGRRLITVIVNNGLANAAGVQYPSNEQSIGIGFAQFMLLSPDSYSKNGGSNNPWCAVYVGPSPAPDTLNGGGGGTNGTGVAVIRLVQ